MSHRLRAVPYTWNSKTDPVEGVALLRGRFLKVFIPYDEVLEVSDRLVDIYESHDREKAGL
ncbi:hypothetical protein [Kocuria rhizophila]|uniref:hypothetical protein n=1 Tax=Kocuria rhizophila TaxID=72000 RepID=UPI0032AF5114